MAFHPQADGRSEQTNKTVGQILRSYTAKRQGKWLEALPSVEFAINSAVNISTGISPFELLFGCLPYLFRPPELPANSKEVPLAFSKWCRARHQYWAKSRNELIVS
jgi:hypothetical protein